MNHVKVCGKVCQLRQSTAWYFSAVLVFVCVAVATVMAEGRRNPSWKSSKADRPIREIATLVYEDPNPAPSIFLRVSGAKWCGPCQRLKPILEDLKKEGYSVKVYDVDKDPDAPSNGSLPYLQWERFGEIAKTDNGFKEKEELKKTFEELEGAIFRTVQGRVID